MNKSPKPVLLYWLGLGGAAVVVIAVLMLFISRSSQAKAEAASRQAAIQAGPRVRVLRAGLSPGERKLQLEGEARPFASVTLYAKVSGYLRELRVDRGDAVEANQVLAVIESPELDRQYEGALADLRNKQAMAKRAMALLPSGVVSIQESDVARTNAEVAQATVEALKSQKSYETLRAPFRGTVTARYADLGALVQNATSSQTSALPVLTVAQIDRLRVYVYLDQRSAASVQVGNPTEIRAPERPDTTRKGKVTRLSRELDLKSKTMLIEIDLDNGDHAIIPGSFVSVSLRLSTPQWIEIPVEALVFRGTEAFVAVVDAENRVKYRPVKLADQDGQKAQLLAGLSEGELVALNVGESIADGQKIQPVPADGSPPARNRN
jgi:membrane fusion protein (multidrug efflux system)